MKTPSFRLLGSAIMALAMVGCASHDWMSYRQNSARAANQRAYSALSDPARVPGLAVRWSFPATGSEGGSFYGSPIAAKDRVFIGSTSGHFYALEAATGKLMWQFPAPAQPALLGSCIGNGDPQSFGRYGVMSSAVLHEDLVIFGAPDPNPSVDGGLGSARLWALNRHTGALVWASDVVARVTACTPGSTTDRHERIAYSSPLVFEDKVYVGTHDSGDDPIQNGRVVAVDVHNGHLVPGFNFEAAGTRGGGVWDSPATDGHGILFTTGNTRCDAAGCQPQPTPDYGLSMLKVNPASGAVQWRFRAVPYNLDDDPDWSAGAAVMHTSCGELAASVEKDGWTYAVDSHSGACRWQFPPTAPGCQFAPGGPHDHGDTDYKRPGAAWGDVLVIHTGGEALLHDGVLAGYGRLHALNACAATNSQRVRWLVDVPHASTFSGYSIGAPTVTHGIVYVPTDQGHVVALADPSVSPPSGYRCSNIDFPGGLFCVLVGYTNVPIPAILADVALPDGADAAGLRNEIAIARGRLFVGTLGGHVYMLAP